MLPGGVIRGGERRRGFAFRPVDGRLESAVSEAAGDPSPPAAVTEALVAALAHLGDGPADAEAVRSLAVGDRQYLVRRLAAHLGRDPVWLTAPCAACGEAFDVRVEQAALPVKEAGAGFPFAEIEGEGGRPLRFRVPDGAAQEALGRRSGTGSETGKETDAERDTEAALAELCRLDDDGEEAGGEGEAAEPGERAPLTAAERMAAEAALEAASPEVAPGVTASCPGCGKENAVRVSPYLCLSGNSAGEYDLVDQIHRLACCYGWSEADILALPRRRRLRYLDRIDRDGAGRRGGMGA